MKKILLSTLAIGLVVSISAQTAKHIVHLKTNIVKATTTIKDAPSTNVAIPAKNDVKKGKSIETGVTVDSIGQAANPLGLYNGGRTALWADPNINSVMFTHREVSPSGSISYDYSTDGGTTFTVNHVVFISAYNGARYPQGLIYNPSGNTTAANAYAVTFAALRDGSNPDAASSGDWGGYAIATNAFGQATPLVEDTMHSHGAYRQAIPDAMHINPVSGKVWVVEPALINSLNNGYTDSLIINQGVFNSTTHAVEYTQSLLYAPVSVMTSGKNAACLTPRIAFAPDGQKGWISFLSCNDPALVADSCYYPILYKTTDGGATWTGPINVDISSIPSVKNFISDSLLGVLLGHAVVTGTPGTRDSILYTTAFDDDMAVDANGNPYIAIDISIGVGSWSVSSKPGALGMFTVYSTDGGTTWDGKFDSYIETLRGTFGTGSTVISEDNRPQISTDWAGTKMFTSWIDTDTILYTSANGNYYPDIHVRGLDCVTKNMTPAFDVSKNHGVADGGSYMGTASYYVFKTGTTYTLPFAFQIFDPTDATTEAQFYYINGFTLTDADFTSGINEQSSNINFVSQNYPNPFNGNTQITVGLLKSCDLSVNVVNMIGQSVETINMGNVAAGNHNIIIDGSKLNSGIYFYTVTAGGNSVTHKMIVE